MRWFYVYAAGLMAAPFVHCATDQLRAGRRQVAKLKKGVESLLEATAVAGHGRRMEEYIVQDNTIYIELDSYNTLSNCQSEAPSGVYVKSGSNTPTYSGCVANEAGTASQKGECNTTHIIVEFFSTTDCTGTVDSRVVYGVNQMFELETCSASSDTGYDLFARAQCRVGPSSLKGNGNSFTQYERAGEACSSGCTNPISYTVFMSGVCASVTGQSGSTKTTRCKINSDDTFTLTENAYLDDSCSTLLISNPLPDQDVLCTDPVQVNVTTADDDFGQNGFIYTTSSVSQASCNSAAPSQCGSAVYLSGAAGILTALLAATAASLALHFA